MPNAAELQTNEKTAAKKCGYFSLSQEGVLLKDIVAILCEKQLVIR